MSRFIRHVTLTTGHTRDSTPDEITPAALEAVTHLLTACIAEPERTQPIPHVGPYSLSARRSGKCLTAIVWADGPPSESIATIGVATHSRCGATLWRALHQYGTLAVKTDPARCPPEPWVAAALEAGIARHLDATHWLGDFERCVGHAFLGMAR